MGATQVLAAREVSTFGAQTCGEAPECSAQGLSLLLCPLCHHPPRRLSPRRAARGQAPPLLCTGQGAPGEEGPTDPGGAHPFPTGICLHAFTWPVCLTWSALNDKEVGGCLGITDDT